MDIAKVIRQRIQKSDSDVQLDSDVNAVVAANIGERGRVTKVTSTQRAATSASSKSTDSDAPKVA